MLGDRELVTVYLAHMVMLLVMDSTCSLIIPSEMTNEASRGIYVVIPHQFRPLGNIQGVAFLSDGSSPLSNIIRTRRKQLRILL